MFRLYWVIHYRIHSRHPKRRLLLHKHPKGNKRKTTTSAIFSKIRVRLSHAHSSPSPGLSHRSHYRRCHRSLLPLPPSPPHNRKHKQLGGRRVITWLSL